MNSFQSYVTCPFNESHRILKHRCQKHIVKCSKNYPKNMKYICPFDMTHRLFPDEFEHHLAVCSSSGNVQCFQSILEPVQKVGTIPIEEACALETRTDNTDDWFGNNPTYNPIAASEKKMVFRIPIAMSKSEKKKFKQYERQRLLSLENDDNKDCNNTTISVEKKEPEGPLRVPKHASKAESHDTSILTDNLSLQMKNISIDKSNDTLVDKNSSKLNNGDLMKNNNKTVLTNISVNDTDSSSVQKNSSQTKQKENVPIKETHTNASEKKDHQTNILPKLIKHTSEQQKRVGLDVQNGILYGEPKKVSTGRGFILARLRANPNIPKKQENKNSEASTSASDYEDN